MDGYTDKRRIGERGLSRNSALSFRDPNHEERSFQYCNRTGCSTRHDSMKSTQNNNIEKSKYMKPSFRVKSSNSDVVSSSRSISSARNLRKSYNEHTNQTSHNEADVVDSKEELSWDLNEREEETEELDGHEKPTFQGFSTTSTYSPSSSNDSSTMRNGKKINQRFAYAIQDTASSFLRRSSGPRSISQGIRRAVSSVSDVLQSDCSSSNGYNRRGVSVRRKLQDGEGSSNPMTSLPEHQLTKEASKRDAAISVRSRNPMLSLREHQVTKEASRRDAAISVRTRRSFVAGENSRMKSSEQEIDLDVQLREPILRTRFPYDPSSTPVVAYQNPSRALSLERSSNFQESSYAGRPGSSSWRSQNRSISLSEDRDDYRLINMEGIAEVLLALERIEQDEELTYEQLLVLEANLFLGGLSFYDQHRDMRLDIDNMSYEELLALEEMMGTVSTALSEEALSKCLKISTYRPSFSVPGVSHHGDGDTKCSICQEEYMIGIEVGRLTCDHRYHVECIHQWLRLKNWCPICKAPAASSKQEVQH